MQETGQTAEGRETSAAQQDGIYTITIITPLETLRREASALRLSDESGSFGILRGHADMVTAFSYCLGYYLDTKGVEMFIALEGGMLTIESRTVTITAHSFYESRDAGELEELIETAAGERERYETYISRMLEGIERTFLQKTVEMEREKGH